MYILITWPVPETYQKTPACLFYATMITTFLVAAKMKLCV
ncbi:hypothetical protein W04_3079 [Pseudoalteromonas sp. SW0106-04]|nr:hypothetical protein W04_3079 [Pseudoalteromonas sp. SW0106-04]